MQTTSLSSIVRTMRPGFFTRAFSTSQAVQNTWKPGPAPPRLPKAEQDVFEKLQAQSTGAFSTPANVRDAAEKAASSEAQSSVASDRSEADKMLEMLRDRARVDASGEGEELHPNVRRGAAPEFQGERNPKTGEVGGPKNEPLRWGETGDWSYNGRVTDF